MSIYDESAEIEWAENKYILPFFNQVWILKLESIIERYQWAWTAFVIHIVDEIKESKEYKNWQSIDPLCKKFAHYNVFCNFLIAYAIKHKLNTNLSAPKKQKCELCDKSFFENEITPPIIERFSINHLYWCQECISKIVFQNSGIANISESEIVDYLHNIADVLNRVPTANFGEGIDDFIGLNDEELIRLIRLMKHKPKYSTIRERFGSWLNALIQANVLEDGTRRTSRGTQCIAKDGDICFSLGEKTIDDFLFINGIKHEKEAKYPQSNFRTDFKIGNAFIEYFGLVGNKEYDEKIKEKRKMCKDNSIKLIEIYPKDLVDRNLYTKKIIENISDRGL